MATVLRLEELEIWRFAREYARQIGELTNESPIHYDYGLRQQMRNASGSVMDNIAEGFGRGSKNEFINHLTIAKGSLEETRSQLYRCLDYGFITGDKAGELLKDSEILLKRISAMIKYLNLSSVKGAKFKGRP